MDLSRCGLLLAVVAAVALAPPLSPASADTVTPSASASSAHASLMRKDRGSDVAVLQRRLGITDDGIFGPDTEAAVKSYQRSHGLTDDGVAGPITRRRLGLRPFSARDRRPVASSGAGAAGDLRITSALRVRLDRIAACESGGNPRALSPGGTYRGKYQFLPSTWRAVGGKGDPAKATESEQDRRAAILLQQTDGTAWPNC